MADNKIVFEVQVTDKGSLQIVQKQVDSLGKAVNKTAGAHTAAHRAASGHFDAQAKGVIGTAGAGKNFSKLAETIGSSSGLVGAYATLAANVFAVTAAFGALSRAAQVQQVVAGLQSLGDRMGQSLDIAAEKLQKLTGFALSNEEAMRATAQITSAGLGIDAVVKLGKAATDTSFALGRGLTDSMTRLTEGVVKMDPELLDELGLFTKLTESNQILATQLGKSESSLSNYQKRMGFLNAITQEATNRFGGLAEAAGNTKNLDILGATFKNLVQDILNLINNGALPLAGVFSNKGFLLGAMVLFASTISKQLIPGLGELSKKSAAVANQLSEDAKKQALSITKLQKAPKGFNAIINTLQAGGDPNIKQLELALNSVDTRIKKYEDRVKLLKDKQKIGPLDKTDKTSLDFNTDNLGIMDAQKHAVEEIIATKSKAATQTQAASAIESAGNLKVAESIRMTRLAWKSYKIEQLAAVESSDLIILSWTRLKIAGFGLSLSLKAVGSAFLAAIPIIGQVILAATLLYEGFNYLHDLWVGKDQLAFNEALADQEKILGKLAGRMTEVNRIRTLAIGPFLAEQKTYEVVSNTLLETIKQYEVLADAQDKLYSKKSGPVKVGDTQQFKTLTALRDSGLPGLKEQIDAALGKDGLTGYLEDGNKLISKNELGKLANDTKKLATEGVGVLGQHLKDLADDYRTSAEAISKFNLSMVPTTPYDEMVKQLDTVTGSLNNVSISSAGTKDYIEKLAAAFSSTSGTFSKFYSVDTQKLLKDYTELYNKIAAAKGAASPLDLQNFELLKKKVAVASSELYSTQQLFLANQNLTRQTTAQVALEQARLSKLGAISDLSGENTKKSLEAQNHIIQLQVNLLKAQKAITDSQLAQLNFTLSQNEALLTQDGLYKLISERAGQGLTMSAQEVANQARKNLILIANYVASHALLDSEKKDYAARASQESALFAKAQSVIDLQKQRRDLSAQQQQQQTAITTQLVAQTSAESISAQTAAVLAKTQADNADMRNQKIAQSIKLEQTLANIQIKTQGRVQNTAEEYNQLLSAQIRSRDVQVDLINKQRDANKANFQSQLVNARAAGETGNIAFLQQKIEAEDAIASTKIKQLDADNKLAILDKYALDTSKEGLTLQQQSLDLYSKALDVRSALVGSIREQRDLDLEIARKRAGVSTDEFSTRTAAIKEAIENYKLAVDGADLRKNMINLEYALLNAKRLQDIFSLQTQSIILKERLGADNEQSKQLDTIVNQLKEAGAFIEQAKSDALKASEKSVDNARKKITSATLDDKNRDSALSMVRHIIENNTAVKTAEAVVKSKTMESSTTPKPEIHISPVVESTTKLIDVNTKLADVIKELTSAIKPTEKTNMTAKQLAQMAGNKAVKDGFRVSEMDNFGGVTAGAHKGKGHGEGRAFDLNIGKGNVEFDNPEMRSRMNSELDKFRDMGAKVLFGVEGHFDHAHVEFMRSASTAVSNIVDGFKSITDKVAADTAPANDNNEITVTATKKAQTSQDLPLPGMVDITPIKLPDIDIPPGWDQANDLFKSITTKGDNSISSVFNKMAEDLGPAGTLVPQIISGISGIGEAFDHIKTAFESGDTTAKFVAIAEAAQQALGVIQAAVKSSAAAKIAGIDAEIQAEEKRDGKSAQSVAKIRALDAQKDAAGRKAFEINKKLMMAQAIIATATGVATALAVPVIGPYLAVAIGALGAVQLAIIAGTNYQSTAMPPKATLPSLSIGKVGDSVNLAKSNPNVGGELGYLRGSPGHGGNSSNYSVIGSAYGGKLGRGYGHTAFAVGEKGPEILTPDTPITVRPMNDNEHQASINATFHINAIDAQGVAEVLHDQRGNIISMIRGEANSRGINFLEGVKIDQVSRPGVSRRL